MSAASPFRGVKGVLPASSGRRILRKLVPLLAVSLVLVVVGCQGNQMPAPIGQTAAPGSTVAYNAATPFHVGIAPNRAPPVALGDILGFTLSSSVDGYGHLYLLNATDDVWVLAENVRLVADAQVLYPPPGGGLVLRATPPVGVERILLLVTRHPFAGFAGGAASAGPVQLAGKAEEFITDLNATTQRLREENWALVETRVEIVNP